MDTNGQHELACQGDSASWQTKKQGAGSRFTGACMARVKIGKLLLLVCALCISATAKPWASTDAPPPAVTSFAYRISHPFAPLPDSVIEKIADQEYEPEESTDYNGFDMPPEPTVDPRTGPSRVLSRSGLCSAVASVARAHDLPIPFFANLIWQESSFESETISRAGAQGIAQFMPKTAVEYGLMNPFEPIHALNVAGKFLRELHGQFGNLGLAAAAYNAGPRRVSNWMTKGGALPAETRNYVLRITGRSADHWKSPDVKKDPESALMPAKAPCIEVAEEVEALTKLVRVTKLMNELSAAAKTASEKQQVAERDEARSKAAKGDRNRKAWASRLAKVELKVQKREAKLPKSDSKQASKPAPAKPPKHPTKVAAKSEPPDISSRNKSKSAEKEPQTKDKSQSSPKEAESRQAALEERAKPPKSSSRRARGRAIPYAFNRHSAE
jgi:hypothetical protein